MNQKNTILLEAADVLAEETGALAIISFIPHEDGVTLKTPVVNVLDINPEILREHSMLALVDYCSNQVVDAVLQFRILTSNDSGTVVAVFPYALLIYSLEDTNDELSIEQYSNIASSDVIHAILNVALQIAHEGREGRSIGTAFIIGDIEELQRWSHQGVLNPYEGHPENVRDITNEKNWESIKEFAQLDGVFLIDNKGIIQHAGRYLDADSRDIEIQSGLGGRHLSAAAITKVTPSLAIVISESGGVIHIFHGGNTISVIRTDLKLSGTEKLL